jgi:hypothetical protein
MGNTGFSSGKKSRSQIKRKREKKSSKECGSYADVSDHAVFPAATIKRLI